MLDTGAGSPLPAGEPVAVQPAGGAVETIEARLRAIRESGDLSLASGPDADRELQRLRCVRGASLRAAFARGWLYWYRQLAVPGGQVTEDSRQAFAEFLPCFSHGMAPIPDGLLPGLAVGAMPEATTRLQAAIAAHDAEGILAATVVWWRIQAVVPPSAAEWPRAMVMLCVALQGKFEVTGKIADLDDAINAGRRGIAAVPGDAPALGELLASFAAALRTRFSHSGCRSRHYIDEAIAIYRQAIMTIPEGNWRRVRMRSSLCAALHARFMAFQDEADLTETLGAKRNALTGLLELDPAASLIGVNSANAGS
jgi:hypothetical protein